MGDVTAFARLKNELSKAGYHILEFRPEGVESPTREGRFQSHVNYGDAQIVIRGKLKGDILRINLTTATTSLGPAYVLRVNDQRFVESPDLVTSQTGPDIRADINDSTQQLLARIDNAFRNGRSKMGMSPQKAFEMSLREESYSTRPAKILPVNSSPALAEAEMGSIHLSFRDETGRPITNMQTKLFMINWLSNAIGNADKSNVRINPSDERSPTWGEIAMHGPAWAPNDYLIPTTTVVRAENGQWQMQGPGSIGRLGKSLNQYMGFTANMLYPIEVNKGKRLGESKYKFLDPQELRGFGEEPGWFRGSLAAYQSTVPQQFWGLTMLGAHLQGKPGGGQVPLGGRLPGLMAAPGSEALDLKFAHGLTLDDGTGLLDRLEDGRLEIHHVVGKEYEPGRKAALVRMYGEDDPEHLRPLKTLFSPKSHSPAWAPTAQIWEIPMWINQNTGVFSATEKPGTVKVTEEQRAAISKASGVNTILVSGIRTPKLRLETMVLPNSNKIKGSEKVGLENITESQTITIAGQTVRVDVITDEFKSGNVLHKLLESRSPEQLDFMFHQYAAKKGSPGAKEWADWYHDHYVAVPAGKDGFRPFANLELLAEKLQELERTNPSVGHTASPPLPTAPGSIRASSLGRDLVSAVVGELFQGSTEATFGDAVHAEVQRRLKEMDPNWLVEQEVQATVGGIHITGHIDATHQVTGKTLEIKTGTYWTELQPMFYGFALQQAGRPYNGQTLVVQSRGRGPNRDVKAAADDIMDQINKGLGTPVVPDVSKLETAAKKQVSVQEEAEQRAAAIKSGAAGQSLQTYLSQRNWVARQLQKQRKVGYIWPNKPQEPQGQFQGFHELDLVNDLFATLYPMEDPSLNFNANMFLGSGIANVPNTPENKRIGGHIHPDSIEYLFREKVQTLGTEALAKASMEQEYEFVAPDNTPLTFEQARNYNVAGRQLPRIREKTLGQAFIATHYPTEYTQEYQGHLAQGGLYEMTYISKKFANFFREVTRPEERFGYSSTSVGLMAYNRFQSQFEEGTDTYTRLTSQYDKEYRIVENQRKGNEVAVEDGYNFYRMPDMSDMSALDPRLTHYHKVVMPREYTTIDPHLAQRISDYLNDSSNTPEEQLVGVTKMINEGVSGGIKGSLLYLPGGVFLPTPKIVTDSTLFDPGTGEMQSGNARLWLKALKGASGIMVPEGGPTLESVEAGVQVTKRYYEQVSKEFLAHGERYKSSVNTLLRSGVSGRYGVNQMLGANEIYIPRASLRRVLRQLGFKGESLTLALETLKNGENIPAVGYRIPDLSELQIGAPMLVSEKNMALKVGGPERLAAINSQRDLILTGPWISKKGEGDMDYDQALFILGIKRNAVTGEMQVVNTGKSLTGKEATRADYMAAVVQLGIKFEASTGKDINIFQDLINQQGYWNISDALKSAARVNVLKGPGAGARFNVGRVINAMVMVGNMDADKAIMLRSSMQHVFTPGIDAWETVIPTEQMGGRLTAAIGKGYVGSRGKGLYLHYGSNEPIDVPERMKQHNLDDITGFKGINIYAGSIIGGGQPGQVDVGHAALRSIVSLAVKDLALSKKAAAKHGANYLEWMPKSLAALFTPGKEDATEFADELVASYAKNGKSGLLHSLMTHFEEYYAGANTPQQRAAVTRRLMMTVPAFHGALVDAATSTTYGTFEERMEKRDQFDTFMTEAQFTDDEIGSVHAESVILRWEKGERHPDEEKISPEDVLMYSPWIKPSPIRDQMERSNPMLPYAGKEAKSVTVDQLQKLGVDIEESRIPKKRLQELRVKAKKTPAVARGVAYADQQRQRSAQELESEGYVRDLEKQRFGGGGGAAMAPNEQTIRRFIQEGMEAIKLVSGAQAATGGPLGAGGNPGLLKILGSGIKFGENETIAEGLIRLGSTAETRPQLAGIIGGLTKKEISGIATMEQQANVVRKALGYAAIGDTEGTGSKEIQTLSSAMMRGAGAGVFGQLQNLTKTIRAAQAEYGIDAAKEPGEENIIPMTKEQSKIVAKKGELISLTDQLEKLVDTSGKGAKGVKELNEKIEKIHKDFPQLGEDFTRTMEEVSGKSAKQIGKRLQEIGSSGGIGAGDVGVLGAGEGMGGPGGVKGFFSGGNMGRLGRELFGGWGLMYMRSVMDIMTGGAGGAGAPQANELQMNIQRAGAATAGVRTQATNFQTMYQNRMALTGGAFTPQEALQMAGASNPSIRMGLGVIQSGLGGYAASMWGASQFAGAGMGAAAEGLASIALPIAGAVALGSLALNAYGTSLDTDTLAYNKAYAANKYGGGNWDNLGARIRNVGAATGDLWNRIFAPARYDTTAAAQPQYQAVIEATNGQFGGPTLQQAIYGSGASRAVVSNAVARQIITANPYVDQGGAAAAGAFYARNPQAPGYNDQAARSGMATALAAGADLEPTYANMLLAMGVPSAVVYGPEGSNGRAATWTGESYQLQPNGPTSEQLQKWATGAEQLAKAPGWNWNTTPMGRRAAEIETNAAADFANQPERANYYVQQNQMGLLQRTMFGIDTNQIAPTQVPDIRGPEAAQRYALMSAQATTGMNKLEALYSGDPRQWAQLGTQSWVMGGNAANPAGVVLPAVNLANMPAMQTTFGGSIAAEYAQFTGYNMAGQQTGGAWGQQSFQMGSVSGATMAARMYGPNANGTSFSPTSNMNDYYKKTYGSFGAGVINAGVNGQALANGQIAGGFLGQSQFAQNRSYDLQMAAVGIGFQQIALQEAFTTGVGIQNYAGTTNPQTGQPFGFNTGKFGFNVNTSQGNYSYQSQGGGAWGLADAQRYMGYAQTESGFSFQQRGMNLQAAQFSQSMGLQQQQINLGVAQGTQAFQYKMGLTQQEFGFGQTMYHEQARFLSGRERRLAEMQNKETITVHGMEVGQAEKEFGFQKQGWKIQEEQHKLQIKQFNETKKLQQDQLNATIAFYHESKSLQEEAVKMERAQWVNQIALQKDALGIQAEQISNQKTLNDLQNESNLATSNITNSLSALNADVFPTLLAYITKLLNLPIPGKTYSSQGGVIDPNTGLPVQGSADQGHGGAMGGIVGPGDYVGEWGPEKVVSTSNGLGVVPAGTGRGVIGHTGFAMGSIINQYMGRSILTGGGGSGSEHNQPVNIYIGNEKLASFVISTVTKEIHR
jgi:hypothetical protein